MPRKPPHNASGALRRGAVIIIVAALAGCAAKPLGMEVVARDDIAASYIHGNPVLESTRVNTVSLTVLEAREDSLLVAAAVTNNTPSPFDFGPASLALTLESAGADIDRLSGRVHKYEDLAASRDSSLAWDSANIVTGAVVPSVIGGGIGGSVLRGFISLGMHNARDSTRAGNRPPADTYLRRHTVQPDETLRGVLKIGLPQPLDLPRTAIVTITTPADAHRFEYRIAR